MNIFQLLPTISYGDAVGNDTRAIDGILRENGFNTGIFAENIDHRLPKGTADKIRNLPDLKNDDVIICHCSTGSKLNEKLLHMNGRKIMIYHNITPAYFFEPYSKAAVQLTSDGLAQIRALSSVVDYCIADSEFNKSDLQQLGFACPIDVCPILIPFEDYEKEPDSRILDRFNFNDTVNILFVGRIAPNKKQEDLIKTFYFYHKYYNPDSRLIICGTYNGMEKYYWRLLDYAECLGLTDSIIFTGHIKFNQILAWYRAADLFLCMSEHEGFCVPLLEAMHFGIPIAAYKSTAVPDTLGDGGILLDTKDPNLTAEIIDNLLQDDELKVKIREQQLIQLKRYQYQNVKNTFLSCLTTFLESK